MSQPPTAPPTERRGRPGAVLDASREVLWVPVLISGAVLGLAGLATFADPSRRWVGLALAAKPEALPGWWATVLYVLVALSCLLRARADAVRRRYRGGRWAGVGAVAWAVLGALLTVLSVDHVLGLHNLLEGDPRLTALPGPVAAHPVQSALLLAALPVVLLLLVVTSPRQRGLLLLGGGLYLVSGVLIDQRIAVPPWNHDRLETAELAFEWAGALVLMLTAMARVRMGPSRVARAQLRERGEQVERRAPEGGSTAVSAVPRSPTGAAGAATSVAAPVPDAADAVVGGPVTGVSAPAGTGAALLDVVSTVDRLRSPGGCPWDAEQTHASLAPFAVEEGYEVAEAAEGDDPDALREELGDLLLQVVLHARLAQEHPSRPFDVDDVARTLEAKLRRRHPHVFDPAGSPGGTGTADGPADPHSPAGPDAAEVEAGWEDLKAAERAERGGGSAFDGVPVALPALARAQEVVGRAERVGVGPAAADVADLAAGVGLGDHLLDVVRAARLRGVDAEAELRGAVRRLEASAREHEARARD